MAAPFPTEPTQQRFFEAVRTALDAGTLARVLLAGPRGPEPDLLRVQARPLELQGRPCLSLNYQHRSKDVTRNLPPDEALTELAVLLDGPFANAHLVDNCGNELQLAISRKGRASLRRAAADPAEGASPATAATHDRAKRRPVDIDRPWLAALGITDARQQIVPAMARKWKQINRFVELLSSALDASPTLRARRPEDPPLRVLDFGAGKGYLSFAVHDHLVRTRGLRAEVTGIDLKDDMVALGNATAERLGLTGLRFEHGDVRSLAARPVDVMIALHACDIATDHALHRGVRAGASVIMCSPCCHKELRPQLRSPTLLLPLLRHGIHLGQEAEMLTDGLRALLLEAEGYDTQVFEFTSLEHTAKNKMILGVQRPGATPSDAAARTQVRELKAFYGVDSQCLESLLDADRAP